MLSKETFCEALKYIKEQEEIDFQFSNALNLVGNGHFVYGVPNKYLNAALLVLKESVEDKYDYIDWWLYEVSDDHTVWSCDESQSWDLSTAEALYDYIINECK